MSVSCAHSTPKGRLEIAQPLQNGILALFKGAYPTQNETNISSKPQNLNLVMHQIRRSVEKMKKSVKAPNDFSDHENI